VSQSGETETWIRELADGGVAVALFNKGDPAVAIFGRIGI